MAPAAAAGRQAAAFNKAKMAEAPRTRTENGAVTFAGSGNPLFDFFFQASPSSCTQVPPNLVFIRHTVFELHALQRVSSRKYASSAKAAS